MQQHSVTAFLDKYMAHWNAGETRLKVIEFGGFNDTDNAVQTVLQGHNYTGIDTQSGMNIDVVCNSTYNLPLSDHSADVVFSTSHLQNDAFFWLSFLEMCRVVRLGGYIYVTATTNNAHTRKNFWRFSGDCWKALSKWGDYNGHRVRLVNSFSDKNSPCGETAVGIFRVGAVEPTLLQQNYHKCATTVSDIWEHIPTLRRIASQCTSVIELGVRGNVSSWALLYGLHENDSGCEDKILIMNDINPCNCELVLSVAEAETTVKARFIQGNDLDIDLPEIRGPVDLVFIDTWHVYGQLKRELNKYAPITAKYIVLHDTTVDADFGESIRLHFNISVQQKQTGWDRSELVVGLWPAVEDFLEHNLDWVLLKRYTNNNGLTVLSRLDHVATLQDVLQCAPTCPTV